MACLHGFQAGHRQRRDRLRRFQTISYVRSLAWAWPAAINCYAIFHARSGCRVRFDLLQAQATVISAAIWAIFGRSWHHSIAVGRCYQRLVLNGFDQATAIAILSRQSWL